VNPLDLANKLVFDPNEEELADLSTEDALTPTISPDDLEPYLQHLPDREADIIELYFCRRKRQSDIADMFGITQAAVSYRIDRSCKRLKFILSLPQISDDEMLRDLARHFDAVDTQVLFQMWKTTCQSKVSKILKMSSGRVRNRFFRSVERLSTLAESDPTMAPYNKIFQEVSTAGSIRIAVELPQWADRGMSKCLPSLTFYHLLASKD